MIQRTLQEYRDLFAHNPDMRYQAIRGMELLSEWETAAEYWKRLGDKENEAACLLILRATEQGDRYRSACAHLNKWVDETVEQGIMSKYHAIAVVFPEMNRIYCMHYK